jgi:hypothetical protein
MAKKTIRVDYSSSCLPHARKAVLQVVGEITHLKMNPDTVAWYSMIARRINDSTWRFLRPDIKKATVHEAMIQEEVLNGDGTLDQARIKEIGAKLA